MHMKSTATADDVRDFSLLMLHAIQNYIPIKSRLYAEVGKEFAAHKTVQHGWNGQGEYVGADGQTTNNVENFFGTFKRGMRGTSFLQRATFAALFGRICFPLYQSLWRWH